MVRAVWLYAAVLFAAGVACGAPESGKTPARAPTPASTASTPAPVARTTPTTPAQTPVATQSKPPPPVHATTMELRLREIGVDPSALPPLNKLDATALRDVMNTFTKALGVKCSYCHEKDFKAPTANKKITTHMWDEFTRGLALEGGGALYCDSCHSGQPRFLDRSNVVQLGDYMQDNYVEHVKRTDKKEHSCETCHGEPFEGDILTKRWK